MLKIIRHLIARAIAEYQIRDVDARAEQSYRVILSLRARAEDEQNLLDRLMVDREAIQRRISCLESKRDAYSRT